MNENEKKMVQCHKIYIYINTHKHTSKHDNNIHISGRQVQCRHCSKAKSMKVREKERERERDR